VISASFTIREADPGDYLEVADLTEAGYRALGDARVEEYVSELRDVARRARHCPILVAVDEPTGRPIGTITYVRGPGNPYAELERDGEAGIRMLAVAPEAQGRGVGRALIAEVAARARTDGRIGIGIHTRPSMTAAHRLYEGLGFVRDPGRDWEFEPGEWLWALSLKLPG
jgi:ribosomal protein S18 acetylase RimI-like enzyme